MSKTEIYRDIVANISDAAASEAINAAISVFVETSIPVAIPFAIIKGIAQTAMMSVYDDVIARQISHNQKEKILTVFDYAQSEYWALAKEHEWSIEHPEGELYFNNIKEFIEGVVVAAMNECQNKKLSLLGGFFGRSAYYGIDDLDKFHHIRTILSKLTYRQICLLKIINERFLNIDPQLCICNPYICVELNELLQYGFWQMNGISFNTNNSGPIQVTNIIPTQYCENFIEFLPLNCISIHDINDIYTQLSLQPIEAIRVLTEEDYENSTTFHEL